MLGKNNDSRKLIEGKSKQDLDDENLNHRTNVSDTINDASKLQFPTESESRTNLNSALPMHLFSANPQ